MSTTKMFEIRDAGTFIPAAAVFARRSHEDSGRSWLLGRAGWAQGDGPVHLFRLDERGEGFSDPLSWSRSSRTMAVAHEYIREHWFELASGDVIDVEVVLGITETAKTSERFS